MLFPMNLSVQVKACAIHWFVYRLVFPSIGLATKPILLAGGVHGDEANCRCNDA